MLTQQDGNVSDKGDEADYAADHVLLAVQERLTLRVELGVICEVVVALGEEAEGCLAMRSLAVRFESALQRALVRLRTCAPKL